MILWRSVEQAGDRQRLTWIGPLSGKYFVAHSHLDAVGLAGEQQQARVLRLPAEFCDRAVVAVAIRAAADAKRLLVTGVRGEVVQNRPVGDAFDQTRAEDWSRDAEGDVVELPHLIEIRLRQATGLRLTGDAHCIRGVAAAGDCE